MTRISRGHPKRAADDYLALYRAGVAKTNTVVWSVSMSLIVAWLSVVEPAHQELGDSILAVQLIRAQDEKDIGFREEINKLFARIQKSAPNDEKILISKQYVRASGSAKEQQELAAIESRKAESAKKRGELAKKIENKVSIGAFGTNFLISRKLMCVFWMALLAWMFGYLVLRREALSSLLERSVESFIAEQPEQDDAAEPKREGAAGIADIAGDAPFWLAPLAAREKVQRDRLRDALGWSDQAYRSSLAISVLVVAVMFAITCRIVFIGFLFTDESVDAVSVTQIDSTVRWGLNMFLVGALLVALFHMARWLLPKPVSVIPHTSHERRLVLGLGGGLALWGVSALTLSRLIGWSSHTATATPDLSSGLTGVTKFPKNPRYRQRQSRALELSEKMDVGAEGFYDVSLSGSTADDVRTWVIYVDEFSRSVVGPKITAALNSSQDPSRLVITPTTKSYAEIAAALPTSDVAFAFENSAIAALRKNDEESMEKAIQLLQAAVFNEIVTLQEARKGKQPSCRLFDLLATIYARRKRIPELQDLARQVTELADKRPNGYRTGDKQALLLRADKWTEDMSKWRIDRAKTENRIVWSRMMRNGIRDDIDIKTG